MNLGDVCSRFLRLSRSPARRGAHMPPAAYKRGARTVGARGAARVTRCGSGSVVSRTSSQKRKDVVLEPRVKARRVHVGPGVGGGALGGRQLLRRRGRRRRGQKRGLRHRRGASTSTQPGTRVPLLVFFFFRKCNLFYWYYWYYLPNFPFPHPRSFLRVGVGSCWVYGSGANACWSPPLPRWGKWAAAVRNLTSLKTGCKAGPRLARVPPRPLACLGGLRTCAPQPPGAPRPRRPTSRRGGRRGGFGQRCRERRG